jgi:hypothetical protein
VTAPVHAWRVATPRTMLATMRTILRGLAGVAVVAAVGFLWAHFGLKKTVASLPALNRQASVADFKLDFPSSWRVEPARADPRVPLGDELALASTEAEHAQLVVGTSHPAQAGGLPQGLQATLGASPAPQVVSLGGANFYRYLNLTPTGQDVSESIYSLPTTIGTITAICSADGQSVPFTSSCERVLGTLQLTSGSVLSLVVDPGYALALNRILAQLNSVRRSEGSGLRAASVQTRIRAASALAKAHAAAASSARHISAVDLSVANQSLVAALDMSAAAYRALATAATKLDVAGYGRAEAEIAAATRALDAAFARLRQLGYHVR